MPASANWLSTFNLSWIKKAYRMCCTSWTHLCNNSTKLPKNTNLLMDSKNSSWVKRTPLFYRQSIRIFWERLNQLSNDIRSSLECWPISGQWSLTFMVIQQRSMAATMSQSNCATYVKSLITMTLRAYALFLPKTYENVYNKRWLSNNNFYFLSPLMYLIQRTNLFNLSVPFE